jgi:hypothetical protein
VEKRNLRRADLVTSVILLLFSGFVFFEAFKLVSKTLEKGKDWYTSAGLFPLIVSVCLALCALLLLLRAWKDGARLDFMNAPGFKAMVDNKEVRVATIIIGWLAIYIFGLLKVLPYWLATFVFLFVFMLCFKKITLKSIITMLIISVCATVALTYGFGTLAMIPLP